MKNATVNQLMDRFRAFADGHFYIRAFEVGALNESDLKNEMTYPFMNVEYSGASPVERENTYNFIVSFADLPRRKDEVRQNIQEIHSDLTLIALDLLKELRNGKILFGSDIDFTGTPSIVPFTDENHNFISGVTMELSITAPDNWNACIIPADFATGGAGYPSESLRVFSLPIYDEGNFVVDAYEINFVGGGVTVTNVGNRAVVTISGGGGGGGITCDDLPTCATIVTIVSNISALGTRVTTAEGDIDTLQSSVSSLGTRVTTAESDIDALESAVNAVEVDVSNIQTSVTALDGRVTTVEGDTAQLITDVTNLDGRVSAVEGDVTTLQSNVTTLQSDVTSLDGRLDTAESDIDTLQAEVLAITTNNDTIPLTGSNVTTTSATLVDITGLVTPTLPANSTWFFEVLLAVACTGTGGVRFGFTSPSGAAGTLYVEGTGTGMTGYQQSTTGGSLSATAVNRFNGTSLAKLVGRIIVDATSGAVQLQFASGTAGQTSTIAGTGGSIIKLTRVA